MQFAAKYHMCVNCAFESIGLKILKIAPAESADEDIIELLES